MKEDLGKKDAEIALLKEAVATQNEFIEKQTEEHEETQQQLQTTRSELQDTLQKVKVRSSSSSSIIVLGFFSFVFLTVCFVSLQQLHEMRAMEDHLRTPSKKRPVRPGYPNALGSCFLLLVVFVVLLAAIIFCMGDIRHPLRLPMLLLFLTATPATLRFRPRAQDLLGSPPEVEISKIPTSPLPEALSSLRNKRKTIAPCSPSSSACGSRFLSQAI